MNRVTQRQGDIGVTQAIATFTKMGFDVALPITESALYDLIVDTGRELYRVQVKTTSRDGVDLRRKHTNTKGTITKYYEENAFDWLYILKDNGIEYLIKDKLIGRTCITPQKEHII